MRYVVSCVMKSTKIFGIDTFFLFFYVRLRFRMMDNLFFVEKNFIKSAVSHEKIFYFSLEAQIF